MHDQVAQLLRSLAEHEIFHPAFRVPFVPEASPQKGANDGISAEALSACGRPGDRELEEPPLR